MSPRTPGKRGHGGLCGAERPSWLSTKSPPTLLLPPSAVTFFRGASCRVVAEQAMKGPCLPGALWATSAPHPGGSAATHRLCQLGQRKGTLGLSTLPLSRSRLEPQGPARRPLEPRSVIWCCRLCSLRFSAQGLKQLLSPTPAPHSLTLPWAWCQSPGGEGMAREPQGQGA